MRICVLPVRVAREQDVHVERRDQIDLLEQFNVCTAAAHEIATTQRALQRRGTVVFRPLSSRRTSLSANGAGARRRLGPQAVFLRTWNRRTCLPGRSPERRVRADGCTARR